MSKLIVALAAVLSLVTPPLAFTAPAAGAGPAPNVVLILLDDARLDDMPSMPDVTRRVNDRDRLSLTRCIRTLGCRSPVEVPWWQDAEAVVREARERHGLRVTVLRLLSTSRPDPPGGAVTYLAEVEEPPVAQPRGRLVVRQGCRV
jgi:hypothetical protein